MFGNSSNPGIVPQAITHLFQHIHQMNNGQTNTANQTTTATTANSANLNSSGLNSGGLDRGDCRVIVKLSMLEIYLDQLKDLLLQDENHSKKSKKLKIRRRMIDDKPFVSVDHLIQKRISSQKETMDILNHALLARKTSATNSNATSSRSHTILTFTIEKWYQNNTNNSKKKKKIVKNLNENNNKMLNGSSSSDFCGYCEASTLTFVDLAGSERVNKSGYNPKRLKEAQKINRSISSLGNGKILQKNKSFYPPSERYLRKRFYSENFRSSR